MSFTFDEIVSKMLSPMDSETAIALNEAKWWEVVGLAKAGYLQLMQASLDHGKVCMEFSKAHEAIEFCMGRPVWTHELANVNRLLDELATGKSPTFAEIVSLIPAEKLVQVQLPENIDE